MHFIDTNILLYAISTDPAEARKAAIARTILDQTDLAISVQVLQEFYVQATRPNKTHRLTHSQAVALIDAWLRYPVQEITLAIMTAAFATKERFEISYWDAAMIESARALNCTQVYSEDLQNGQDFGGIRIVNPFIAK